MQEAACSKVTRAKEGLTLSGSHLVMLLIFNKAAMKMARLRVGVAIKVRAGP